MLRWRIFAAASAASIAAVAMLARRDSADAARCASLVAMGNRCCAEGQTQRDGICAGRPARCPPPLEVTGDGCVAQSARIAIAGGVLRGGAGDWEAEGRAGAQATTVAPFAIDSIEITEGAYAGCVAVGRCALVGAGSAGSGEPGRARGEITRAEAESYCAFRGGRLPTSEEWAFAAAGVAARRYPWGDTGAVCRRAWWGLVEGPCGFGHAGPELAGLHPEGATPEGVQDMAGNVSEWVANPADDVQGEVRGGSFSSQLATDLRTWQRTRWPASARSPEIGARCAYDVASASP